MAMRLTGLLRGAITLSLPLLVHCTETDADPPLTSYDAAALPGIDGGLSPGDGGGLVAGDAGAAGDGALAPMDAAGSLGEAGPLVDAAGPAPEAGASPEAGADAAAGDAGADAAAADAAAADSGAGPGAFPSVGDLTAAGPYRAVTVTGSGPGGVYTVYHPEPLAPGGLKNPFVTWGNGLGTTPDWYELLPHLASHGFVVIASDNFSVTPEELRAGIDWLFAENERSGSVFFGKLDTSRVASMGYSLGSDCTFKIADDPRLITTIHISGGAFDKADTARLRNPAMFLCGAAGGDGYFTGDVAHENCETDFDVVAVPTFYGVFNEGGHLGIMLSPHMERIRAAVTGWLRWQLMGDQTRAAMFTGSGCTLCSDPNWTVKQKQL